MSKGNISKIRNVLGVSVLALVLSPIVANAAEVETIKGGTVDSAPTITASSNLASNYTIENGNLAITGDGSEDIVVNLQGKTISVEVGSVSVANTGKKVTIQNGNIVCKRANSDCVTATTDLKLEGVNITSNKGKALNVATAEIKNSNLTSESIALTIGTSATYESGVLKGAVSDLAKLTVKGTVTGPVSLAEHAEKDTKIIVDAVSTAAINVAVAAGKTGIVVDFSKVDFSDTTKAYTISYNSKEVTVTGIPAIFRESDDSTVAGVKKYQIKEADTTAYKKAVEEFTKAMDNEEFVKELTEKYTTDEIDIATGLTANKFDASDIRTQNDVDKYTAYLNKLINKEDIKPDEVPTTPSNPTDTNPGNTTDGMGSGDDEPTENPQTFDALLSYVGMALASVGGIAVSLKKVLFR